MKSILSLRCALMVALVFVSTVVSAQNVSLDDLRTPPSPAFILLGVEPSSVERPSSPRAVALSLLSATSSGEIIPKDYALEVAPYWLSSHPTLTFDDYYNADVGQSVLQTLALSLATSTRSADSAVGGTSLGFGVRTTVVPGRAPSMLDSLRSKLRGIQDAINETDDEAEEERLMKEAQAVALAIQALDKQRIGWTVEAAAGLSGFFPQDDFDMGLLARSGLWVTTTYRLEEPFLSFIGLLRYMGARGSQSIWDFGARILYQDGSFSVSGEYVHRSASSSTVTGESNGLTTGTFQQMETYRLSGLVEYRYNDDIAVYLTIGRTYEQQADGAGTLLVQLGVDFGFGEIPVLR